MIGTAAAGARGGSRARTHLRLPRPGERFGLFLPWLFAAIVAGLVLGDGLWWGGGGPSPMPCHGAPSGAAGMGGLPASLYYGGVAAVLLVSFLLLEREAPGRRPARLAAPDLLRVRWIRVLVAHPATRPVAQGCMVVVFALILAAGLFGNQLPNKNIAPVLTWTVWWCGLVLLVLYAGKAWCYVCPWDAVATWSERLGARRRRASLGLGLRWPRWARNIWPATALFVALTWAEIGFGLTMKPRATAWLGLGILALAFASVFLFDRKSFCRYGCLVGRISGLYALFAPVEVRARDRELCRTCATRSCFHGNGRGDPCPTFQYLGAMEENTYCISCMECVRTCERDNVALRLRPWGSDLAAPRRVRSDEAYLALVMLALSGFHGLTMTARWGEWVDALRRATGIGETLSFTLGMGAILVGPVLLYAVLVAVSRWAARARRTPSYRMHFLRYAYALLPIALFYHLAHNSEHLLVEGPRLLALVSDPFGWEWNLFGTARWEVGPLAGLRTLWALQVLLVLVGHVYSLWASRRAAEALYTEPAAVRRSQVPMLVAMVLFSVMSLWLLRQPMQMRTTWM